MNFSDLLKLHMAARGLNQYTFAKLTGINQPTVSRWMKGKFPPSLDKVYLICEKLNISVAEFFSIENNVNVSIPKDPNTDGYISAITNTETNMTPDNARAFRLASEAYDQSRKNLHQALDRLIDEYESKKHD